MNTGERKGWPQKSLSAAFVRTVREPGFYADGNGLYLKVEGPTSKRWVQRIVVRGHRRDLGLGSASLVSLAEAREQALQNRKTARAGGDPVAERKAAHAVPTFEAAARTVHELHAGTWRNRKHAAQWLSTVEEYVVPIFGRKSVGEVSSADILRALAPIWTVKPETARRVRQRIGTVLKWAIAQGWRHDNPAASIATALPKHDRQNIRRRQALDYRDVAVCIDAVKRSKAGLSTKLALEFLVLTITRSRETRLARWEEIDLIKSEWVIPRERMKSKRAHRVPLSQRALDILSKAKALDDGSGLVFPGSRSGSPLSDMTLSKLIKELGFKADVHGFRTSFRTWSQECSNAPSEVAEAALAHVIKNKAEAAYARSDLFERRRELMREWADHLSRTH